MSARCDELDGWGSLFRCYSGAYGRKLEFRHSWQEQVANQQLVNRREHVTPSPNLAFPQESLPSA